jgi:hypothetical protein
MKPLVSFIFLFFSNYLSAQLLITCNSDSVPIRLKPIRESKPIIRRSKNAWSTPTDLQYNTRSPQVDSGYFWESLTGF